VNSAITGNATNGAEREGWNAHGGGFHQTLGWNRKPRLRAPPWWPSTEGIGAAAFLAAQDGSPECEVAPWCCRTGLNCGPPPYQGKVTMTLST